jgi:GNAT superfamily N-acetyltransferase
MDAKEYELASPVQATEWCAYHDIRRRVLFAARGEPYNENHPDEHAAGNYPKLLKHHGQAIGVVRIDVAGAQAFFRRVAVDPNAHRRGHGRVLLSLAERFAREQGCVRVGSYVAPDAVDFYLKCGFAVERESVVGPSGRVSVFMSKRLYPD